MRNAIAPLICVGVLLVTVAFGSLGCSCSNDTANTAPTGGVTIPPIKAVWDWIVGFATDAGQYVKEKATTFAAGAIRLWRVKSAFWGVFRETPARELAG